jgi:hypothetical protein
MREKPDWRRRAPFVPPRGVPFCHSRQIGRLDVPPSYEKVVHKEENTMKKLVLMVAALGLTVAFAAPVIAADKVPTTKAACEKAKMHWDAATKACTKGSM